MKLVMIISFLADFLSVLKTGTGWFRRKRAGNEIKHVINNTIVIQPSVVEHPTSRPLNQFEDRSIKMFEAHQISTSMIPPFCRECIDTSLSWKPSDISDPKSIINLVGPQIYDCAELFGVSKAWLHGDENIYPYHNFYKDTGGFMRLIFDLRLKNKFNNVRGYAIRSENGFDRDNPIHQSLYIVLTEQVTVFNNRPIYRYIPIQTDWNWGYWRSRLEVKTLFYLEDQKSDFVKFHGVEVSEELLRVFNFASQFPDQFIRLRVSWSTYDYANSIAENGCAKEIDEFPKLIDYLHTVGTMSRFKQEKDRYMKKLFA